MRLSTILICVYSFLVLGSNLFGQTNQRAFHLIPFLDADSQSNIVVIVNELRSEQPLPPSPLSYTNLVSNTNLFSPADHELLTGIPIKYKNVTTNSGPLGTVFLGLSNSVAGLVAQFEHTNSGAREVITFTQMKSAKFRTKSGDGYDVDTSGRDGSIYNFLQIQHGEPDGLFVSFYEGHCASWMRFAHGKAVGRWLMWGPNNRLLLEAKFKEPYDFFKHAHQIRM